MEQPRPSRRTCARFGVFEADLFAKELRKSGVRIKLQEQPFQVLAALLQRSGEVITREELREKLWPADTFVDFDNGLNTAINKIREVLGDLAHNPRFIETLPRRGYRFIAPVEVLADSSSNREQNGLISILNRAASTSPKWKPAATAIGIALVVGLVAVVGTFFIHRRSGLTPKDTVVLADFDNRTGDAIFEDTLKQALATQLAQSPFLNILSDQRVNETLRQMSRSPSDRITLDAAREICQRTGSTAVLAGSIGSLGSQYVIGLNAMNCASGDSLAREEMQASRKEDVLNILGVVATRVRARLGESLASIQKFDTPIEQATTSSLEALKAYSLGRRASDAKGDVEAIQFLKHAIELDPNFALAYSVLATHYSNLGEANLASEYARKGFDRRERVSERERFGISAIYYFAVLGDLEQEQHTYQVWKQTYPRDWVPWSNSASNLHIFGQDDRAVTEGQEAVRLNPDHSVCYVNVGFSFLALNRRDEAQQVAQRALERGINAPVLHSLLYLVAFLENDAKGMDAQLAA